MEIKSSQKEILVRLDKPSDHVYVPGDTVSGNVTINLSPDIDLKEGLIISLYGLATVEWTEQKGQNSSTYSETETFFEIDQTHSASHEQSVYPFSMTIPRSFTFPLPAVTHSGRILYGVKAMVKRPLFHVHKKGDAPFALKCPQVGSATHSVSDPYFGTVRCSNSRETKVASLCFPFCCWYYCCANKYVRTSIDHHGIPLAFPGDTQSFSVEVDNSSSSEHVGNGNIQLVGNWVHFAEGETETIQKICSEQVLPINLPPGEKRRLNASLEIPVEVMPTQVKCKVLKLMYKLRVVCTEISGFRCFEGEYPSVDADVVIGMKDEAPMSSLPFTI